jgi:hypothetical protein
MNNGKPIRIAVVGVGNCASSLIQGIHYYTPERCRQAVSGLMHTQIGDYLPCDIEVVAAFDIDARKVGTDVNRAIFAKPNCTKVFQVDIPYIRPVGRAGTQQGTDRPGTETRRSRDSRELRAGWLRAGCALLRGVCARSGLGTDQ